jgi:serine protease AprX
MDRADVLELLYPKPTKFRGRRFTQDTPVLAEVWIAFGLDPSSEQELLLTPNAASNMQQLVIELRARLAEHRREAPEEVFIAYNESHVLVTVSFPELVRCVLPLSVWWERSVPATGVAEGLDAIANDPNIIPLMVDPALHFRGAGVGIPSDVLDMIRVVGGILINRPMPRDSEAAEYFRELLGKTRELLLTPAFPTRRSPQGGPPPLWTVSCNREVETAVSVSRLAVKADAAIRLFEISCEEIIWGVVDSGIDASHDAFIEWPRVDPRATGGECPPRRSRVLRAYDFTLLSVLQEAAFKPLERLRPQDAEKLKRFSPEQLADITRDLKQRLIVGRPLDWHMLEPFLRVDDKNDRIEATNQHGTHVAGILAADWRAVDDANKPFPDYRPPRGGSIIGICPDIRLYDLRVIGADGRGAEFSILAALQFTRYLNMNKDKMVIHGVNLSFSLPHNVKSYACGSTPVCQECERLVNSGVVVVSAAGNRGYAPDVDNFESYRSMTITDPGNAESVITVGSTHRMEPHRYGVSYFSSRGPTGDGRMKPDLVAPGEKIRSVAPGADAPVELDGTSMAAPHVSGAAALLMARHRELIGTPRRVKQVLRDSATDLGRERAFQGAGLLDVLRALQSV